MVAVNLQTYYIDVTVSRSTSVASVLGFGTPLFIGETDLSPTPRVASYSTLSEVKAVYGPTDPETLAAAAFFSQSAVGGKPKELFIGYKGPTETYSEALTAIRNAPRNGGGTFDTFFTVSIESAAQADIEALAATIRGTISERAMIGVFRTNSADALNPALSTDVGSVLKALVDDYNRVVYHSDAFTATNADGVFPEMAQIGRVLNLPENQSSAPGVTTWNNQRVTGIVGESLTRTQMNTLQSKNYDYFANDRGAVRSQNGRMAGDEWADIIHGVSWLEQRVADDIYNFITKQTDANSKVPYTQKGIDAIGGIIEQRLQTATNTGLLDGAQPITVTLPDIAQVSAADLQARRLTGVGFTAVLKKAVKFAEISGIVTLN